MAIRVGGTVVVDNSRNLSNTTTLTATTHNATTICGTTVCGTFCGSLGAISASNLTGIPANDVYICQIACETIAAGSPVSTFGTCGIIATKGSGAVTNFGGPYGCNGYYPMDASGIAGVALNFSCNPNCFVSVQFQGGGGQCNNSQSYAYNEVFACIRVHSVSATGSISSTCLCCFNYGCNGLCCVPGIHPTCACITTWNVNGQCGAMPLCSPTGSKGGIMVPYKVISCCSLCNSACSACGYQCNNIAEFFFCYCTTTCTISLLRHCHGMGPIGGNSSLDWQPYVTNDKCYVVSMFIAYPYCTFAGSTCRVCFCNRQNGTGWCCAELCTGYFVKALSDTMCLLSWVPATGCTGTVLQSVIDSTALCGVLNSYYNSGSCCLGLMYSGLQPFTQGADGWTINYFNTFCNCAGACIQQFEQRPKLWAHKAIADNVYSMTNIICTWTCACQIPFFYNNACKWNQTCLSNPATVASTFTMGGFGYDEGGCKKLVTVFPGCCGATACNFVVCYHVNCFCVSGATLSHVAYCISSGLEYACWGDNMWNWFPNVGHQSSISQQRSVVQQAVYAMYRASTPLCYQCSCYWFFGQCNVIRGSEYAPWGSNWQGDHYRCSGCNTPLSDLFTSVYTFKPSFSLGASVINQITCCGSSGGCSLFGIMVDPMLTNANTTITSVTSSNMFIGARYDAAGCAGCPCGSVLAGSAKVGFDPTTVCNWVGIAQNSAAAGANVCYAVPGMVDRSPFSTNLSAYTCENNCLIAGFNCVSTVGGPCSLNGLTVGNSSCGRFCNYGTNILFRPFYDSAKGCYVTMIEIKSPDTTGRACGL